MIGVVGALDGGAAHGVHIYEESDPALVRSADDPDMLTITAASILARRDPKSLKDWEGRRINRYRVLSNGRKLRRYSRTEIDLVASALPDWLPPEEGDDRRRGRYRPESGAAIRAEGAGPAGAEPAFGEATDLVDLIQGRALDLDYPLRVHVLAVARQLGKLRDDAARLVCMIEQLQARVLEIARKADVEAVDRAALRARLQEAIALLGEGA